MKAYLLINLFFITCACYCQESRNLIISIEKTESGKQDFAIYNVSIANFSDSIICVLHSRFVGLSFGNQPQALTTIQSNSDTNFFNLESSATDTLFTYEVNPYFGTAILPYQSLFFKIIVPSSSKRQFITLNYFNLYDFNYRKFKKDMLIGNWYKQYKQLCIKAVLPSNN